MAQRSKQNPALTLSNNDGALTGAYSVLANFYTGQGTSRAKSQTARVSTDNYLLSEQERIALIRTSAIARKAVYLYPQDASRKWIEFLSDDDTYNPKELENYFQNLKTGTLQAAFKEASIEARLHGDGYILLGIDDGQDWDKPVDESRIRSFRWVEPLAWNEVTPDTLGWLRKPEFYNVSVITRDLLNPKGTDKDLVISKRVHKSRILRISGNTLYNSALYNNAGKNESVLQVMWEAFSQYFQGIFAASSMLADYSVFKYKLAGLAKLIQQGDQDAILQRFLALQMGMSTVKGLALDATTEDAEFVSRNYGGVKDILETLLELLVSACDIPRNKLLGSSAPNGMGQVGNGEMQRYEWAAMVHSWQVDHWQDPLSYCQRIALLAKDGVTQGNLPEGYGFRFKNIFQLTPVEEIELRLKKAQENKINIELGIYTPLEARLSGYGGTEWSPEITLDNTVTERLRVQYQEPEELPDPQISAESDRSKTSIKKSSKVPNEDASEDYSIQFESVTEEEFDAIANITEEDIERTLNRIFES